VRPLARFLHALWLAAVATRPAGALVLVLPALLATCHADKIVSPPPVFVVTATPSQVLDSALLGSAAQPSATLTISTGDQDHVAWTAVRATGGAWLSLDLTRGATPSVVTLTLNPAGLPTGIYRDTIIFTLTMGSGATTRVPVELRIQPCTVTPISFDVLVVDSLRLADCAAPHGTGQFGRLYSFMASAGDSVSVTTATSAFPSLVALDTSAAAVAPVLAQGASCPLAGHSACLLYRLLPRTGTYIVEITSGALRQTGQFSLSVTRPHPPLPPESLAQLLNDSATAIAAGASISQAGVVLRAVASDPDAGDSLHLEVEVRAGGIAFTGTPTAAGGRVANGTQAWVGVTGLGNHTAYHWQCRTVDQTGRTSAWILFRSNAETAPDFTVAVPQAPTAPIGLDQFQADGATVVPIGGTVHGRSMILKATVMDPDPGDQLRLDVEVQPVGSPFTNTPTASSTPMTNGATAVATVAALVDNTSYHWQGRTVDQTNLTSAWVPFAGNAETDADFKIAVPPTQLVVMVQPTSAVAGATMTPAVRVGAEDAFGNAVESFTGNVTVAIGNNAGGGVLSGTTTVAAGGGVATFSNLRVNKANAGYTLQFTTSSLVATSTAFNITPGAVATLAFAEQPASTVAGMVIAPAVQIAARDSFGNTVTGFTGNVTISIANNPAGGTLSGAATVAAVAGVATFSNLSINKIGASYTLQAGSGTFTAASAPFSVMPATASQLALTTQPSASGQSGLPLPQQPGVEVQDRNGNPVSEQGMIVTASLATGPGGASLIAATATTDASGLATFGGLAITGLIGSYSLKLGASGLAPATSNAISLTAGPVAKLAIVTQPSGTVQSGVAFPQQPVTQLQDAAGNPVSQSGAQVTATIGTGSPTLGGTNQVLTNAAGAAAFTDLTVSGATGPRTLRFAAQGVRPDTSGTVTVIAGVATQIAVNAGNDGTATAGTTVAVAPSVIVRDASGNPVAAVPVTFAVAGGGGSVTGANQTTNANGIATIGSWTLGTIVGVNTLTATSPGLAGSPVTFIDTAKAGSPASMTKSSGDNLVGPVGTTPQAPHQVLITDVNGNPVQNVPVVWAAASGGGTVNPATMSTDNLGHAQTMRTLGPVAGTQTTTATATIQGSLVSDTFNIMATAGDASQMVVVDGQNQTGQVGTTLPSQLLVKVTDRNNNPVPNVTVTWSVTSGGGSISPSTSQTGANGIANTSWTLGTLAGVQTVQATAIGLPVVLSATATAGPVSSSQSTVTVSPAMLTASSGASAATITVTAKDANGNLISGAAVVLAATGSGNALTQPPGTTNASGVAIGMLSSIAAGTKTVSVAINGTAITQQATVPVTPAAPSRLAFLVQPSDATAGFAITPPIRVGVFDAFGNEVTSFTQSVTLSIGTNPGGGTLSGTTSVAAAAGVAMFADLSINRAQAGYTLAASAADLAGTTSTPFNINVPVASVVVSPASATVLAGQTVRLTATPTDAGGNALSGRVVTWASSDASIATVDAAGLVTGVRVGATTITATSEGIFGISALKVLSSGGVIFQSNWSTALGATADAVGDGGVWEHWDDFDQCGLLSVVAGGPAGYANALRVQQRGPTCAADVNTPGFVPLSTSYYLRYYMRNDDTSPTGDHVVTCDVFHYHLLTYLGKESGPSTWAFYMLLPGGGYPLTLWRPPVTLAQATWYRFEYFVEFTDATHMRVHPRVYDAAGTLLASDADFQQQDFGSALWNGRSDWTLASYYAAGFSFDVSGGLANLTTLGFGNNGQAVALDTGLYWYYAGVQVRTDTWPGP